MRFRILLTALALCATSLLAQTPATPAAPAELSVQTMTCADLLFLLGDERQSQDATYLMLWAYGVKTGATGADLRKNPLSPEGLKAFVRSTYDTCKVKSDTKLLEVLTGKAVK
jgi:hypothetical protein